MKLVSTKKILFAQFEMHFRMVMPKVIGGLTSYA